MCGIVGFASDAPGNRAWLVAGRDSLAHRGPDDAGLWLSEQGHVGLAQRRLAIIDLSPAGHQPMADVAGELRITFNGEIYNFADLRTELVAKGHVLRSSSDTEVILAAYREWGVECLARLNGMFAFALYDARNRTLFLARDRAGEKPLFYTLQSGALRFASELKALMADRDLARRIDPEALDFYLAMSFVPGDRCILEGVHKLPPAHALLFDVARGEARVWRYWQLPEPPQEARHDGHGLLGELEALLEDAVRRQLVADVPVGVLLSGGVDSSLVTAMAARSASRVKTFTVRFPGYGAFDETEHARLVARHFGTEHLELEAAATTVELLPRLAAQFDEPMVDSSMIPTYLVSRLVREHCTVALGGDGGDELFAGYTHYSRLLWIQEQLGWIPLALRRLVASAGAGVLPLGAKGRNYLPALAADRERDVPPIGYLFDRPARSRLMSRWPHWRLAAEAIRQERVPRQAQLLQRATRMDFENYLAEDLLVKVDRASMLTSLEVRAPLLDYRIVEFAFGRVPAALRATATSRKILLKQLAARVLPPEFDRLRKQGFSIPLASWLESGPWLELFREVLLDANGLFAREAVQRLFAGQAAGRNNGERLFGLVLFELWRREYRATL